MCIMSNVCPQVGLRAFQGHASILMHASLPPGTLALLLSDVVIQLVHGDQRESSAGVSYLSRHGMPPCRALLKGLALLGSLPFLIATSALDECKIGIMDLSDPSFGLPKCDLNERCAHMHHIPQ